MADSQRGDDRAGRRAPHAPAGMPEAVDDLAALADKAEDDPRTERGRPPTCSPSSTALVAAARCARRPAARTGARTSRSATTSTGAGTSTSVLADGVLRPSYRPRRARMRSTGSRRELPELSTAGLDADAVHDQVLLAIAGGPARRRVDVTSDATVPVDQQGVADFVARERRRGRRARRRGAGVPRAGRLRRRRRAAASPTAPGSRRATCCCSVTGPTRALLTAERTALNLLCHLSGRRHRDPPLGRRARRHRRPGPRHPQDHARPARAGEVRRALRRRRQPPDVAVATWRWSRTTTCSRRAACCRRTAAVRERYPDLPVEVEVDRPRPAPRAARRRLRPGSCSTT